MKQESKEYYDDLARFYDWRLEGNNEDIPFYVQLAKESGGPVLELGCGTGRVTLPIAEAGIETVGIDLSADMLDIARQKLSRMPGEIQGRIQFVEGNMAHFALEKQFALVILPANQFRELLTTKEQISCLHCIGLHLKEEGSIIIEVTNPFRSIKRWTVGEIYHRKVGYCQETGTIVECLFKTTAVNLMEQWVEQETIYVEHLSDGSIVRHTGRSRSRCIFPRELELLLEISNFEVTDKWGDYDRSCLEDSSPCLIVRARRVFGVPKCFTKPEPERGFDYESRLSNHGDRPQSFGGVYPRSHFGSHFSL
jgi:SAM-dependent methyltransferase